MRNKLFLLLLVGVWGCGIFRDPRANCNHPKHEEYLREQQAARLARETRSRGRISKTPRQVQKSCPHP